MPRLLMASIAALLALDGCAAADRAAPAAAQTEAPAPLTPSGPPEALARDADENLQWSAAVVKVDFVPNQTGLTAKLFGTAGGDPAMNGLYTYIAFLTNPHEPWEIYRLGDFLDYRILSAAPGHVDVEIRESTPSTPTSEIGARTRNIIVSWTPGPDGAPPTAVTVTPAQ